MSATTIETQTSKSPGLVRAILFSLVLGTISSVVGITFLLAILFAYGFLERPSNMMMWKTDYILPALSFVAGYIIIYAVYAIVPATSGGGVIGLILHTLARRGRLYLWISMAIGALVGLIEGGVTTWIIAPTPNGSGWIPDKPRGFFENGLIGIIAGLFVAMILHAWFRRKMT